MLEPVNEGNNKYNQNQRSQYQVERNINNLVTNIINNQRIEIFMKVNKNKLKKLIREETKNILNEQNDIDFNGIVLAPDYGLPADQYEKFLETLNNGQLEFETTRYETPDERNGFWKDSMPDYFEADGQGFYFKWNDGTVLELRKYAIDEIYNKQYAYIVTFLNTEHELKLIKSV